MDNEIKKKLEKITLSLLTKSNVHSVLHNNNFSFIDSLWQCFYEVSKQTIGQNAPSHNSCKGINRQ